MSFYNNLLESSNNNVKPLTWKQWGVLIGKLSTKEKKDFMSVLVKDLLADAKDIKDSKDSLDDWYKELLIDIGLVDNCKTWFKAMSRLDKEEKKDFEELTVFELLKDASLIEKNNSGDSYAQILVDIDLVK